MDDERIRSIASAILIGCIGLSLMLIISIISDVQNNSKCRDLGEKLGLGNSSDKFYQKQEAMDLFPSSPRICIMEHNSLEKNESTGIYGYRTTTTEIGMVD